MSIAICEQLCQLRFVNNRARWMPIFEKSTEKTWDEKIYSRDVTVDGKAIHVIGL